MSKYIFSLLFFCLSYSLPIVALPVESFASLPDVAQLRLSPSGEKISSIVRVNVENTKGTAVQVVNLKTGEKKLAVFTDNKKYDFTWVKWKDEKTLLIGLVFPEKRDLTLGFSTYRCHHL